MDALFDENQPIYIQIVQRICASILRGDYRAGDKLPAVIDAAMRFKVNHNTIQHAYGELVRQGVAVTRRGEGTFVTEDTAVLQALHDDLRRTFLDSFFRQMGELGYSDAEILEAIRTTIRERGDAQNLTEA